MKTNTEMLLTTLCVPTLGEVRRGADIYKEERISVKESACRWPALGGPSGSALMISGEKNQSR